MADEGYTTQVGRMLYHLLKDDDPAYIPLEPDSNQTISQQVKRRVTTQHPDGTIESVEETITQTRTTFDR
jgi:hypothetical protein